MARGGLVKVHFVGFLRSVCIFWPEVSSSETKPTWNNFPACQRCRLLWKSGLLFLVFPLPRVGFRSCYVVRPERFALEWLGFTDLRDGRNGEDRLGQASCWRWALKSPALSSQVGATIPGKFALFSLPPTLPAFGCSADSSRCRGWRR